MSPTTVPDTLHAHLLDASDAARMLAVSVQWIRDHTTRIEPIVPHVKMGRKVRFEVEGIQRFIAGCRESRPRWERN